MIHNKRFEKEFKWSSNGNIAHKIHIQNKNLIINWKNIPSGLLWKPQDSYVSFIWCSGVSLSWGKSEEKLNYQKIYPKCLKITSMCI